MEKKKNIKQRYFRVQENISVILLAMKKDLHASIYSESVNISVNGICVMTMEPLPISSRVMISMFLPVRGENDMRTVFISCRCIVMHLSAVKGVREGKYCIGFRFLTSSKKDFNIIKSYIEKIQKRKK